VNKTDLKLKFSETKNLNYLAAETSRRVCVFPCVIFLIFLSFTAYGKTPAKYSEDVKNANILTQTLIYTDVEEMSPKERVKYERETLAEIRSRLPARQQIEWQGGNVETNNQWLAEKLADFEKQPEDSPKREAILTEVGERLEAIEQKLTELENPSASNRTKDEDKQKLAEILRREEYAKPQEPKESLFQKAWRKFKEWLNEMFPRPNLPAPDASGFQSFSFVLQMILYALILGAIGFLIYRFAPFFAQKFKRRERQEKRERVILGERLADDETAQNLFAEAERLAREGNLRGAIRKGYVALLCELSDRKIIGLARHKTNRDYLRDVREKGELFENMNGLTDNFERHWYGFEAVEEKDWDEFRDGYRKAVGSSRQKQLAAAGGSGS